MLWEVVLDSMCNQSAQPEPVQQPQERAGLAPPPQGVGQHFLPPSWRLQAGFRATDLVPLDPQ